MPRGGGGEKEASPRALLWVVMGGKMAQVYILYEKNGERASGMPVGEAGLARGANNVRTLFLSGERVSLGYIGMGSKGQFSSVFCSPLPSAKWQAGQLWRWRFHWDSPGGHEGRENGACLYYMWKEE